MPGANPRLFIDMIGFVEIGARSQGLPASSRIPAHGRIKLAESESVDAIVEAATHYVARRLLERDKALAADDPDNLPPRRKPRQQAGHAPAACAAAFAMRPNHADRWRGRSRRHSPS